MVKSPKQDGILLYWVSYSLSCFVEHLFDRQPNLCVNLLQILQACEGRICGDE